LGGSSSSSVISALDFIVEVLNLALNQDIIEKNYTIDTAGAKFLNEIVLSL